MSAKSEHLKFYISPYPVQLYSSLQSHEPLGQQTGPLTICSTGMPAAGHTHKPWASLDYTAVILKSWQQSFLFSGGSQVTEVHFLYMGNQFLQKNWASIYASEYFSPQMAKTTRYLPYTSIRTEINTNLILSFFRRQLLLFIQMLQLICKFAWHLYYVLESALA